MIVLSDLSVPVVAEAFSAPGYGVTSFSLAHVLVLVVVNRERLFECLVRVAGAPVRLCALLEASDVIDMMYVIQEMRPERNWYFATEPSSQILLHPPTDKHSVADQIKQLGCPRLQSTVYSP